MFITEAVKEKYEVCYYTDTNEKWNIWSNQDY